jgi:type II secretory pathway pseudopilin PulG
MKQTSIQAVIKSGARRAAAERGASLIEVLVILVILLIGLGTVIRIFPIGLGTLRTTETRTLAVQLANQQAEQLKADAENLPQGVLLAYFDANGDRIFDATEDADSLAPYTPNNTIAANAAVNPYYTDVNKYRFIDGEVVKVPPPVITDDFGAASIYVAKFGPIFMSDSAGESSQVDAVNDNKYLRVYSAPFQEIAAPYRSNGTGANPPDNSGQANNYLRGSQSYLLDPDDSEDDDGSGVAHVLLPPTRTEKVYLISYSYDAGSGDYRTVDKVPFPNIVGTTGNRWEPIVLNGTPIPVVPGSVRVYRLFERVTIGAGTINWVPENPNAAALTYEPYQYALLEGNLAPSANLGRIAFHPSGASYGQRNASGQQAFTAYVDYSVLDWHILREDREVPSSVAGRNGEITVRTTLGNWKREGDPNPGNTIYNGMFSVNTSTPDVVVIDLQTGRRLIEGDYTTPSPPEDVDYWINKEDNGSYRSGSVIINSKRVPGGSQIRILYKAQGDWAVSFQKAYSRYKAVATAYPATDNPGSFTTGNGANDNTRAYFNRSEYNKSFLAQFRYVSVNPITREEKIVQTALQQVTIAGADGDPFESVTVPRPIDYAFADCAEFMPNRKLGTNWSVVTNVAYGVSVKTRVIYRDANSGRGVGDADQSQASTGQSGATAGWRVQDVDTYLTRAF